MLPQGGHYCVSKMMGSSALPKSGCASVGLHRIGRRPAPRVAALHAALVSPGSRTVCRGPRVLVAQPKKSVLPTKRAPTPRVRSTLSVRRVDSLTSLIAFRRIAA